METTADLDADLEDADLNDAEQKLRACLASLPSVIIGFSGGADSALLAWIANDELGDRALAVTAVSPSLAGAERAECAELADEWGLRWAEVETTEMENAAYRLNDGDRCFHCKDALMDAIDVLQESANGIDGAVVTLGVNLDDLGDHRPGQHAAELRGARFPFVEAGLTKEKVRLLSQRLGLRTWDKPAAACLSSRLPYGTPVTMGRLRAVDRAEDALKKLGFRELRVRDYDDTARIEVPLDRLADVIAERAAVVGPVQHAGYSRVTRDLEGLRSGNLKQALTGDGRLPAS